MARPSKKSIPKNPVDEERYRRAISDMDGEGLHTIINQDPSMFYYLAAKDPSHPHCAERMERLGYEIVNRDSGDGVSMPLAVVRDVDGGAIQTGQHVLMRIPRELFEYRQNYALQMAAARTNTATEEFEEEMKQMEDATERETERSYFIMGGE